MPPETSHIGSKPSLIRTKLYFEIPYQELLTFPLEIGHAYWVETILTEDSVTVHYNGTQVSHASLNMGDIP